MNEPPFADHPRKILVSRVDKFYTGLSCSALANWRVRIPRTPQQTPEPYYQAELFVVLSDIPCQSLYQAELLIVLSDIFLYTKAQIRASWTLALTLTTASLLHMLILMGRRRAGTKFAICRAIAIAAGKPKPNRGQHRVIATELKKSDVYSLCFTWWNNSTITTGDDIPATRDIDTPNRCLPKITSDILLIDHEIYLFEEKQSSVWRIGARAPPLPKLITLD